MPKADPLIRTKLRQPFTRPGLVLRTRLQEQIAQGLCGPLTLITAPAGFGKTTLVAAAVAACGMPVAWLSLDKEDNQEGRFLTYLLAAFRSADPCIGSEAAQLLLGMQPAPPETVLTSLVNDLDAAAEELVLVLDDYQFISSQAVHAQVAFLLEHCPPTFHMLVATRSDPPLPLARLRARGYMLELRTADLRFTAGEAAQFLNEVMGLHLDGGSVLALEERTEGWAAGLQMAALSMRDRQDVRGFIEGFSGTNRYILDYLLEEILTSQPPEVQRFLLFTSFLERLTAPLCDALLANEETPDRQSASVLEYLERENLFLISLDDERVWFRYHHLFADLLRARLQEAQPGLVPILHRRASVWLEQKGLIPEAIQHLLAAQEFGQAADLIERYGSARWADGDLSVVRMADGLPPEMLIARPKIGLYQVWLLILQGLIEKAILLLSDMQREFARAQPNADQRWMQAMVAMAQAFLGLRTITHERIPLPDYQILDEIPASEGVLRDTADMLYAMTLGRRGEADLAAEVAIRCIQREKTRPGGLDIPSLVLFLARIYLVQGRLHAAASLCREYLDSFQERGVRFIVSAGGMNIVLGEVLYERNLLAEAEAQIRAGLQADEPWVDIMSDAFGQLALIHVLLAQGDYPEVARLVEKFEAKMQGYPFRPHEFEEDFRTLRVRLQLASGDLQNAAAWADQIQHSQDFQLHEERYWLVLARVRLAQGRVVEVEKMLAGRSSLGGSGNRITRQLEYNLLLAAALAGLQRLPEALAILASSLALAEPEGYVRVFLDGGEPVRELLAAYLHSLHSPASDHSLYARKLLDAFTPSGGTTSSAPQPIGLVEPLSARELEVLQLMALGRTNPEIARQLVVAAGTIKAHAASIYRKLDAANRTEAVARARQLDILP